MAVAKTVPFAPGIPLRDATLERLQAFVTKVVPRTAVDEFIATLVELSIKLDPETAAEKLMQHSKIVFEGITELVWARRALKRLVEIIVDPTSGKKLSVQGHKPSRTGRLTEEREFAYSARIAHNYRLVYWVVDKQLSRIEYAGNRDQSYAGNLGNGRAG